MIDFRDGKLIKLIKQALAYGNKSVTLKRFQKQVVWVGGDSGGGGGGNFGMGVLASILKPTPIIYLAFEKQLFHILDFKERWHIHIHLLSFELIYPFTGQRSAVDKVSSNRCESDCRSRGRKFDPGPVPYFRGNWLWNNFYGRSPPFRWSFKKDCCLLQWKYVHEVLVNCLFKLAQEKSVVRWTDRPAMTIAVDLGRKATN